MLLVLLAVVALCNAQLWSDSDGVELISSFNASNVEGCDVEFPETCSCSISRVGSCKRLEEDIVEQLPILCSRGSIPSPTSSPRVIRGGSSLVSSDAKNALFTELKGVVAARKGVASGEGSGLCNVGAIMARLVPTDVNVRSTRGHQLYSKMTAWNARRLQCKRSKSKRLQSACQNVVNSMYQSILDRWARLPESAVAIAKKLQSKRKTVRNTGELAGAMWNAVRFRVAGWYQFRRERRVLNRVKCDTPQCKYAIQMYLRFIGRSFSTNGNPIPYVRGADVMGDLDEKRRPRAEIENAIKKVLFEEENLGLIRDRIASRSDALLNCGWNKTCLSSNIQELKSAVKGFARRLSGDQYRKEMEKATEAMRSCTFFCMRHKVLFQELANARSYVAGIQFVKYVGLLRYCHTAWCRKTVRTGMLRSAGDSVMARFGKVTVATFDPGITYIGMALASLLVVASIACLVMSIKLKMWSYHLHYMFIIGMLVVASGIRLAGWVYTHVWVQNNAESESVLGLRISTVFELVALMFFTTSLFIFVYQWVMALFTNEMIGRPFESCPTVFGVSSFIFVGAIILTFLAVSIGIGLGAVVSFVPTLILSILQLGTAVMFCVFSSIGLHKLRKMEESMGMDGRLKTKARYGAIRFVVFSCIIVAACCIRVAFAALLVANDSETTPIALSYPMYYIFSVFVSETVVVVSLMILLVSGMLSSQKKSDEQGYYSMASRESGSSVDNPSFVDSRESISRYDF